MATKNWFTPRTLLVAAGIILLGLMVWRFSNIVAYILIASVLSLIARPLVRLLGKIKIRKWSIPVSIRALVTLVAIWAFFFGFFRIFIPLIANEAQELLSVRRYRITGLGTGLGTGVGVGAGAGARTVGT